MTLPAKAIRDVLISHAMALGVFDRVAGHEPKNAPGNGLTCAFLLARVDPTKSGLASTSGRIVYSARIYSSAYQEPLDEIDEYVVDAVDTLFAAYIADFELGGNARHIDIFGSAGISLSALAGYANQDGKQYRIVTITVPVIVNDCWDQSA